MTVVPAGGVNTSCERAKSVLSAFILIHDALASVDICNVAILCLKMGASAGDSGRKLVIEVAHNVITVHVISFELYS